MVLFLVAGTVGIHQDHEQEMHDFVGENICGTLSHTFMFM